MDELYLDNIDEFVNDHNKIVTYKWLSLTLGVHVNTAKQMLYHYLEHKRKESLPQLHATYLVSGKSVDHGQTCHKVSIVREDQLEDFKSKMALVVSVHVYSVQKAVLRDSGPLYSVDYDAVKDNLKNCNRYSAIRCAGAVPMSSVELQRAREKEPTFVPENKKPAVNGDAGVAPKAPTKPPKGIMGMFSNKSGSKHQVSNKDVKPEQKEEAPAPDPPKNKQAAKVNPMAKFFGNQTKKPDKPVKEEPKPQSSVPTERQHNSQPEPEPAAVPQQNETKTASRSKAKRLEASDSEEEEERMEKKKRRRIKRPEPDSSDEDVIPDSPQPLETKQPSPKKELEAAQRSHGHSESKIRKRRRVLKSRTFQDDEGCIVTEKGYESESYSETEDGVPPDGQAPGGNIKAKLPPSSKGNEKKSQKKSSASSQKASKQASIMGFFKKK